MKFNLKLFVLVGALAGFRDVCGMKKVKNKDYDGFIVAGFGGNENKKELEDAMKERRVIKAVYENCDDDSVKIIDSGFKDKLFSILVWDGKNVDKKEINKLPNDASGNPLYVMKQDVKYTVYFIFKEGGVESTTNMFAWCFCLIRADFRCFNTSNVTDMSSMFSGCTVLTKLDLSNFNTINVENMFNMFYECSALKELDLSSFDTSKVTNMSRMFAGCSSLTELNLSSFKTSKVEDMFNMFYECSSLKKLDIRNFNTSKVTNMEDMFWGWSALQKVFLPSKNVEKKKRCICCGDEYVCWNNHEVGGLNPKIVQDKNPEEIIKKISTKKGD